MSGHQLAIAFYISPDRRLFDDLSRREREVLVLIAEGASNNEIASRLTLSVNTVKRHTSNILAKLNATNRTQAVAHARARGLLYERNVHNA